MTSTLPKSQSIIAWKDVFGDEYGGNTLDLISHGCKRVILGELTGLNYRLKTNKTNFQDTSLITQRKELHYFAGSNPALFRKYGKMVGHYLQDEKNYGLVFTRATCLYAIEEIVQSGLTVNEEFTMQNFWEDLFRYILAVNEKITLLHARNKEADNEEIEKKEANEEVEEDKPSLEELNPKLIPLNEIAIDSNSLYTCIRGYHLLEHLSQHEEIGDHLIKYLADNYGFEFDQFVFELTRLYFANNKDGENNIVNGFTGEKIDASFYYHVTDEQILPFFKKLSGTFASDKTERLISIKKFPLYQANEHEFLLIDNILALDKCYNQLINDFWFDVISKLKDEQGNHVFTIKGYRSIIGYFLEGYVYKILHYSFANAKLHVLKMFNELITNKNGHPIEVADIYLRYNNKVFIAQVKSTGLYDNEKFAGDTEGFYRDGRDQFFKSFGLNQIVESIRNIELIAQDIDTGFPVGHSYCIYPAIVVNEKAMQTPLMAYLFNERFKELMQLHWPQKVKLRPLSLIHISDLELMEETLHKSPKDFWNILEYNIRVPKFIPPFYNTITRLKIQPDYSKAFHLYKELIEKYNPSNEE